MKHFVILLTFAYFVFGDLRHCMKDSDCEKENEVQGKFCFSLVFYLILKYLCKRGKKSNHALGWFPIKIKPKLDF